jgi:hypothetical protein
MIDIGYLEISDLLTKTGGKYVETIGICRFEIIKICG